MTNKMTNRYNKNLDDVRVQQFWKWFASNAGSISRLLKESRATEIAAIVDPGFEALFAGVGWEIGPGKKRLFCLSIALNGSLDNLATAKIIVEAAPLIKNWEFTVGRPPKAWDGLFDFENASGQSVSLDASKWRYVLTGFANRSFYDILIIAKWPPMNRTAKLQAVHTAIQNVIGELNMLERFDRIELVEAVDQETIRRSSLLLDLKDHLVHLQLDSKHQS